MKNLLATDWQAVRDKIKSLKAGSGPVQVFFPDTNVLCLNPRALRILLGELRGSLDGTPAQTPGANVVGLSNIVQRELDSVKANDRKDWEPRRNALRSQQEIEEIVRKGLEDAQCLRSGIVRPQGGVVFKSWYTDEIARLDREQYGIDITDRLQANADTKIVLSALRAQQELAGLARVIFVSNDLSARTQALELDLLAEEFRFESAGRLGELWTGIQRVEVSSEQLDAIKSCLAARGNGGTSQSVDAAVIPLDRVTGLVTRDIFPHQAVILHATGTDREYTGFVSADGAAMRGSPHYWKMQNTLRKGNGRQSVVNLPFNTSWELNREQKAFMELALNPDVLHLSVIGRAGTGKTYLGLLAGLYQAQQGLFSGVVYVRSLATLGGDIGYLPGKEKDKMAPWAQPAEDLLSVIFRTEGVPLQKIKDQIQRLKDREVFEVQPPTYMRGRTISNKYVIIDEAQGFTRDMLEGIMSRGGISTKMVIIGDPYQVLSENKGVTRTNNGLVHLVQSGKKKPRLGYAHIKLEQVVRSPSSALATDLFRED
ncbi:AAA family ATPase [Candidatus Woesearchaeota archaeon]|nr:AAA family ATPase [Candidatus Woesearchaeota archaeon]